MMKNYGQTPAIALKAAASYAITDWVDLDTSLQWAAFQRLLLLSQPD